MLTAALSACYSQGLNEWATMIPSDFRSAGTISNRLPEWESPFRDIVEAPVE